MHRRHVLSAIGDFVALTLGWTLIIMGIYALFPDQPIALGLQLADARKASALEAKPDSGRAAPVAGMAVSSRSDGSAPDP
jgi:hypothetical protein